MSLIQFLRILIARRLIILGFFLSITVVALIVASRLPERFPGSARVLMDVIKPDPVSGAVIASQFARGYTKTQSELIKDYRVAGDVVDRLGIAKRPEAIAEFNAEPNRLVDIRRYFAQKVIDRTNAKVVEGSNILEITYEAANPTVAKNTVSAIRDAYIDASLRFRTDSAGRTADWYRQQADKAQKALNVAENARSDYERANGLVMGAGGVDAETAKLQALQAAAMGARNAAGQQDFQLAQTAGNTGIVESLKMQVATADQQVQTAAAKLGPENPTYQALIERRRLLQSELAKETAASKALGGGAQSASKKNVAQLEADYQAQKAKVLGMKDKLDQLAALQREVDLRRTQYEKAAQRTADLKLEADVDETGLVPLGAATASGSPSFPNIPLIGALAALGGLALGVLVAVFVELLGRRVRGSEDLVAAARVPVLAIIADARPSPFREWVRRMLTRGRTGTALQPAQ